MFDFESSTTLTPQRVYKFNDILQPPTDQALRNMRHHVHCKDLHGKIGYYPQLSQDIDTRLVGDPNVLYTVDQILKIQH